MVEKMQNPDGEMNQMIKDKTKKTEPQLVPEEVITAEPKKTEEPNSTWFKPKKGSVFPAKRKLVKAMVFDCIVKWVASVFCRGLSSAAASEASQANNNNIPRAPKYKKPSGQFHSIGAKVLID